MKILVTGGAGFIGSHLVDALLTNGHTVAVVDNLSTGVQEQVDQRAEFHEADVADAGLAAVVKKVRPEAVVHLAAQVDVRKSVADPVEDARVNILGTLNVLEAARPAGGRRGGLSRATPTCGQLRNPILPFPRHRMALASFLGSTSCGYSTRRSECGR